MDFEMCKLYFGLFKYAACLNKRKTLGEEKSESLSFPLTLSSILYRGTMTCEMAFTVDNA